MAAEFENIPILDGWVNLTEAAEMLGITRQHAHKKVRLADEGKPNGWKTVRRVGSKPMYLVSLSEITELKQSKLLEGPEVVTDLLKGTLSREDRETWLRNYRFPDGTTDEDILMAIGSGFA